MSKKAALFAFNGDLMCFVHVLLNALEYSSKGWDVKVIVEGSAVKLIPELAQDGAPMHSLFQKIKDKGLLDGACKACSTKMNVDSAIEKAGVPLIGDMSGHPSMAAYQEDGYSIVTF